MVIFGSAHGFLCQNSLLTLPIICNMHKEDLKNNTSIFSAEIRKKNPEKILYRETEK